MQLTPETSARLYHLGDYCKQFATLMENPQPDNQDWIEKVWIDLAAIDEDIKFLKSR